VSDSAPGAKTPGAGTPGVRATSLSKWYGAVMGLNDVSVEIGAGVTALLGPNGAGKTTFMRMITGQLRPSSGTVEVFGQPVWNNLEVLGRIGFCPEEDAFYDFMSGLEFVTTLAQISGIPAREAREKAERALERVGMKDSMQRRVKGYSKGMRQRTKFAQAMVHDPDLLILDEPMTGADPVARRALRDLIADVAAQGKQVVVSSHVLHEVETLTETFVLISRGRVLASGNVGEIRGLMDGYPHRIVVNCDRPRDLVRALVGQTHIVGVELREANRVVIQTDDPGSFFDTFPEVVLAEGVAIHEFYSEDDTMNAVFRYLIGAGVGKRG
jgi:ABC-2 type transport system ATP-binding protein